MDRRFVFFISSKREDLAEERLATIEEVNRHGHFAWGMELSHAVSIPVDAYIREKVLQSDVLIVILGKSLGEMVDAPHQGRYIHQEIDAAKELGLPILPFLLDPKHYAPHRTDEMDRLRKKVEELGATPSYFEPTDPKFRSKINAAVRSVTDRLSLQERGGYVPAVEYDRLRKHVSLNSDMSNSPIVRRIVEGLSNFGNLHRASAEDIEEKRAMAELFWSTSATNLLIDKRVKNILFEAGSSTDFMASRLLDILSGDSSFEENRSDLNLFFNGITAKFLFDLRRRRIPFVGEAKYFPKPPFEEKYGKSLGKIGRVAKVAALVARDQPMREDAKQGASQLQAELEETLTRDTGLIFLSISGFDMMAQRMPFTDNYRNLVFKTALAHADVPKVLIFDGAKWEKYVKQDGDPTDNNSDGNFFLGTQTGWFEQLGTSPLAVLTSTKVRKRKGDMLEFFQDKLKFRVTGRTIGDYDILYFFNEAYYERFGLFPPKDPIPKPGLFLEH